MNNLNTLVDNIYELNIAAHNAYKPLIDDMLSRVVLEKELEYIMDRFVSFCGYDENKKLFIELCETYQDIYPELIDFQRQQLHDLLEK